MQERPDGDGEHRGEKDHPHLGPVLEQDREEIPQAPRRRLLLGEGISRSRRIPEGSFMPSPYGYFAGVMIVLDVSTPMMPLPTG